MLETNLGDQANALANLIKANPDIIGPGATLNVEQLKRHQLGRELLTQMPNDVLQLIAMVIATNK